MPVSFEWQLFLGAWLIYLLDSAMLLFGNELVFVFQRGKWQFAKGASVRLWNKNPFIPNPLLPGTPVFRIAWATQEVKGKKKKIPPPAWLTALWPIQWMVNCQFIVIFGGLGLAVAGRNDWLWIILIAIYGTALLMVLVLCWQRKALNLSGKMVAKLAFDALACPPLGINLVRKIAAGKPLTAPALLFAKVNFTPSHYQALVEAVCQQIEEILLFEAENSPRYQTLRSYRQRLMESLK